MRIGIDASRAFVENPTGTERYAYEVITRMLRLPEARKHEWVLYTRNLPPSFIPPPSISPLARVFAVGGGRGVVYKNIPLKFFWTQAGLAYRTWVDKLNVLWVPAHTLPILRQPRWLRKGKPLQTVVTIHGIEYEWLPAYENWLQRWYLPLSTQYAVHTASKIIAVSEFTKKQLIERLGADEKKIEVIYEGYTPLSDLPPKLGGRRKWGVLKRYKLHSKQYLLFVGTVQPRKNLERLIEGFAGLGGDLKLVIAGKFGWLYDSILTAPEKYGVKEKVIFTGYIDDQTRQLLLENALVYVQSSITEGFGLPVLEAMAAGVAVVSSNGGALAEITGDAGVLFDPLNINDINHKLSLVIKSQLLRGQLIKKGKERVKNFSWETAAKKTLSLIAIDH